MSERQVVFGWAAPPMAEQFPEIPPTKAAEFDADNKALIRLHIRGFLTDSQRDGAIGKIKREIRKALIGSDGSI